VVCLVLSIHSPHETDIISSYLLFASIFLTVKSVQAELLKGKIHLSDLFTDSIFSTLILSMLSTYVMWFIASVLFNDPWHMFTSFVQYLLLTPTYINILNVYAFCNTNDLSWGTRPATKPPNKDINSTKVDGQEQYELRGSGDIDLNAAHEQQLRLLRDKPAKETRAERKLKKQNMTKEEKETAKKAYYAQVRSGIVLTWVFSNLAVCSLVLETVSVSVIINPKKSQEVAQAENAKIYLQVVLWSVAGLSFFKFLGAMWFRFTTWRRKTWYLIHAKCSSTYQ
jgi:chitin synthase